LSIFRNIFVLQDIEEILLQTSAHGLTYFAEMKYGRMEHKENNSSMWFARAYQSLTMVYYLEIMNFREIEN